MFRMVAASLTWRLTWRADPEVLWPRPKPALKSRFGSHQQYSDAAEDVRLTVESLHPQGIFAAPQGRSALGGLVFAAPAGWTLPEGPPEKPAQMRLIRKTGAQRYLTERCRAGHHQMASLLQPPPHHVSMRCFAEGLFERTREVRRASPRNGTEIPGVDRAVQILLDERPYARDLPAHQGTRSVRAAARATFYLRLQDRRRRCERCLRRLTIMVKLALCGLEKLGQAVRQIVELRAGRRRRTRFLVFRPFHCKPSSGFVVF